MVGIVSSLILVEIILVILGIFTILRKHCFSLSESFIYSIVIVLLLYSTTIQLFFFIKIIKWFFIVDLLLITTAIIIIIINYNIIKSSIRELINFIIKYKLVFIPFGLFFIYLFFQVILLPPSNTDSMIYNLSRVLLYNIEETIFINNYTSLNQVNFPIGYDILNFLFLRISSDYFLSFFSFLSYLVIIVGIYSLVNKLFNDNELSLVTCIMVGSLNEIVLQSTSTKNDIPEAAMTIASFHAAYNFLISGNIFYLLFLIISLVLGISFKAYFWGFAIPFFGLFILINVRQIYFFITNISFKKSYILLISLIILNISCLTVFHLNNYIKFGGFFGDPKLLDNHIQPDGIRGAAVNGIRYIIQSLSLPKRFGGEYLDKFQIAIFSENITLGATKGTKSEKVMLGTSSFPIPREDWSWFGPLGFFLLIPSVIFTLFKGSNFLKIISLSLISFYVILCYKIGWMPWNNRFFSLFFVGSGVCSAFLLNTLCNRNIYKYIFIISFITLFYAAIFNQNKPLINIDNIYIYINNNLIHVTNKLNYNTQDNSWLYFINNRNYYFDKYFGDNRVDSFANIIEPNKSLLIISKSGWIFPYLIRRADILKKVSNGQIFYYKEKVYKIDDKNDYDYIRNGFDYILWTIPKPFNDMNFERLIFKFTSENAEPCFLYKIAR